jgi:ribosomal protein S17E
LFFRLNYKFGWQKIENKEQKIEIKEQNAFTSNHWNPAKQNYSTVKKQVLTIVLYISKGLNNAFIGYHTREYLKEKD